jgi:hypothetical protein
VLFGISVFEIASESDPALASSWGGGIGTATQPQMVFQTETPDPSTMVLPWMEPRLHSHPYFPANSGSGNPELYGFPVVRPASLDVQPARP